MPHFYTFFFLLSHQLVVIFPLLILFRYASIYSTKQKLNVLTSLLLHPIPDKFSVDETYHSCNFSFAYRSTFFSSIFKEKLSIIPNQHFIYKSYFTFVGTLSSLLAIWNIIFLYSVVQWIKNVLLSLNNFNEFQIYMNS